MEVGYQKISITIVFNKAISIEAKLCFVELMFWLFCKFVFCNKTKLMNDLISGATAYLRGIKLINKHGLWLYFWIPVLLSLLLGGLVLNAAWIFSDDLGGWLLSFYPWEWGRTGIEKMLNII